MSLEADWGFRAAENAKKSLFLRKKHFYGLNLYMTLSIITFSYQGLTKPKTGGS